MPESPQPSTGKPKPLLIVISGPSGVGKDSVLQRLKERQAPFHFVVTANTRPPRPDERPGVDYHFVSKEEFLRMVARGEMLEYAQVYNDYKGVPRAEVERALSSGKDVILRLDVQGAATIRKNFPEALLIFLTANGEADLRARLMSRPTDQVEDLELRLATARQEMQRQDEFDYVVPNRTDQLDQTVDVILAIITAEHHRVRPRKAS